MVISPLRIVENPLADYFEVWQSGCNAKPSTFARQAKPAQQGQTMKGRCVMATLSKSGRLETRKKVRRMNERGLEHRMSALDAAELVLKETKKPMHVGELINAMAERKLWESPEGKTPTATLFAAMLREIAVKGDDSRFTKMDRGLFGLKPWERRRSKR